VAFVVEEDVRFGPIHVRFLRAVAVVFDPDGIAHLVK